MPKRPFVEIRGPPDRVSAVSLQSIANVAALGDSCAIAVRHLHAGLAFLLSEDDPTVYTLSHEVLEGHRFAVQFVARGKELLSWGLAFGVALKDIPVGGYIVNHLMLHALKGRREVAWALPAEPNFRDISSSLDSAVELDETFTAKVSKKGTQPSSLSFLGYARADGSVGTRNNIVILGITGNSARFARAAVEHLAKNTSPLSRSALAKQYPNIDGIVPVAHNEGAAEQQNNADLVNRVITNYLRHPNVGAAVILASPQDSAVTAETVANELYREHGIDARGLGNTEISNNFAFLNLTDDWQADLEACAAVALQLAPVANSTPRSKQNVSKLRIALQCGGSDAFSGITGNPLVGDVAQRVVLAGGSAILAETPELVGAEPYILQNCASRAVAEEFLKTIRQYMEYADRHKQDAAGNPSGGNLFRGLYNIGLKSLGASRKMPEDTTLDGILPYGRYFPGSQAGYFFMDSPGNDLESIAGQVATGCNLVFFVTGNGAITNFPFVPTLKVVTTSGRFQKLEKDMDVNAGVLNEGVSMQEAGSDMLALSLRVCSGELSKGERAGHSQVSLWRNYGQAVGTSVEELEKTHGTAYVHQQEVNGGALDVRLENLRAEPSSVAGKTFEWIRSDKGSLGVKHFNLVLPTSLCSSQIAKLAADKLSQKYGEEYCSLPHTEGCGGAGGSALDGIMSRVLAGHLFHPLTKSAFVLEHGCEKTHNDWLLSKIGEQYLSQYGWGSVQGDGGIESVIDKIDSYFHSPAKIQHKTCSSSQQDGLTLAILCREKSLSERDATILSQLCIRVISDGGSVILPSATLKCGAVLRSKMFISQTLRDDMPGETIEPTLSFAERPKVRGLHVMSGQDVMTDREILTGVGASGATAALWWIGEGTSLQAGHPFIPTLHITTARKAAGNADLVLHDTAEDEAASARMILQSVWSALCQTITTRCKSAGSIDFSIPRGVTSVSL